MLREFVRQIACEGPTKAEQMRRVTCSDAIQFGMKYTAAANSNKNKMVAVSPFILECRAPMRL